MPTTYAIPNGRTVMDATTYTGNGSTQTINNKDNGTTGFKPDFVWAKDRGSASYNYILMNTTTGTAASLNSNTFNVESNTATFITAFNSNGFTLGNSGSLNTNADNYIAWQWNANGGTTSSNTNGSITSTVQANTAAGFSIVTYTGTGVNATVGHGLGVIPSLILIKNRVGAYDWRVYHSSIAATNTLYLDTTAASTADSAAFNNTAPTSSVFSVGTSVATNASSGAIIAFCWAQIAGFSQFGSYTANASTDGPFIYTGFRPKFVLFKNTSISENWMILDSSRDTYNVDINALFINVSDVESTATGRCDFLSNGFKVRSPGTYIPNYASGNVYVYAAFAENPFKYANAR